MTLPTLEYGTAHAPKVGETTCGDAHLVVSGKDRLLVAVVDGLGHGEGAAKASRAAIEAVEAHGDLPLEEIILRCHVAAGGTRGCQMALMRFVLEGVSASDDSIRPLAGQMTFSGVGNVELMAATSEVIHPSGVPGIVGHNIRRLRTSEYPVHLGDVFALYSDGISARFELRGYPLQTPQRIAEQILEECGRFRDDRTIVVVRV